MKTTVYFFFFFSVIFAGASCKKYKQTHSVLEENRVKSTVTIPFDFCDDGNPVGGGTGYQDYITQSQATRIISTNVSANIFRAMIESSPGQTIYLMPNVEINLTGISSPIIIPEGSL